MPGLVSNDVWSRLDPHAGRLSRAARWRVRLVLAAVLVVAIAGVLVWHSGVVVAQIGWSNELGYTTAAPRGGPISQRVAIVNNGWRPVQVLGAGRSGRGLRLSTVDGVFPRWLRRGATMSFTLGYQVVDCSVVPAGRWPVPVRVARPWGVQTRYIPLPTHIGVGAPDGLRYHSGRDPYAVEWQRHLADIACGTVAG